MIVRPTNMALRDWADAVSMDLGVYGVVGKLEDEDWRGWGVQFCNNVGIGKNMPNPYGFLDWRDWAERMCEVFA